MDIYSNVNVKGRVNQSETQGTADGDMVRYDTHTALAGRVTTAEGEIDTLQTADGQNVKLTGNQTIAGTKTFSSTISGSIDGNAATATSATKLGTADVGSDTRPIKLVAGVATQVGVALATASDLSALTTRVGTAEGDIDGLETDKADKATTLAGYGITDAYTKTAADGLLAAKANDNAVVHLAGAETVSGAKTFSSAITASAGVTLGASGSIAQNDTGAVTGGAVYTAIQAISGPMVFKGTLGTGGTITTLPAASSSNLGYVYKVITAGTYQGLTCKVGDTVISDGSAWVLIPSGDEPEGTVTNVATGDGLSGGPITSSGTIAVDSTVVRTSGAQTIAGVKTFSSLIQADGGVSLSNTGQIASGVTLAVTGGAVYTALTDGTVSKVGTATVGDVTRPVYLNAGVPTATTLRGDTYTVTMAAGTGTYTLNRAGTARIVTIWDADGNQIYANVTRANGSVIIERATSTEAVTWTVEIFSW